MNQQHWKSTGCLGIAFVILMAFLLNGCALPIKRLVVTHRPFPDIETKKQSNIMVTQFVDKRKEQNLELIGKHVGMPEGVKLDVLLTQFMADAIKAAGYNALIQNSESVDFNTAKYDAIVTGEIEEFWLDFYMGQIEHKVRLRIKAFDPTNHTEVWKKRIQAEQVNVNWVGASGEYSKVIDEALTDALNQAVEAFVSDEFSTAIKK